MINVEEIGAPLRKRVLTIIIVSAFVFLVLRLYQLQLLYHTEFGRKSDENSVRTIIKEPVRGYMFDRNGLLVVDDGPAYSITVTPATFDTMALSFFSSLLQMEPLVIQERLNRGRIYSRFSPVRIKRDVDFKTLTAVEENLYQLSGVSYEIESKRIYPFNVRAPHLLGYCKEITDAQLAKVGSAYQQGDIIGSSGLEASYETFLRGEKGFEFISVNSKGQLLGPLDGGRRDIPSKEGFDLNLSVDFGLQMLAESLMVNYRGALVAIDPNDGGVLALVSKPDFDPSVFSGVTSVEVWNQLNNDPDKSLFNRATMTRYPPGSTFKMLIASAALEEGIIDEHFRITCNGAYRFGNKTFKDLHVHGSMNVVEAIQHSCNVFFYQLILKIGLDNLYKYGKRFGFGQPTGFDIGEETAGILPSVEYYNRVYGKGKWTQGYLVSLGVGQGEVGVSPMQMARYAALLANGGTLLQPHAVNSIRNKRTNSFDVIDHKESSVGIDSSVMKLIREGMRRVVEAPGGTGGMARIPGIVSAGKTGTAENPHGADHAWYIGFAPFDHPKIAIAVMLENAGFGGTKAAPIAGKVMQKYIFGELPLKTISSPRAASMNDTTKHSLNTRKQ
ncbi:MAG: penicillin-binding protein 2 [Ignavibacteriales bacterium]|nr:penicillin-binding protein 2 [Ignavibacteriales bacterium]